jgi:hypothetical protein
MLKLSKRSVKVISVIVLAVMMFMCFSPIAFAAGLEDLGITPKADSSKLGSGAQLANTILSALMWIGVAIAVGMMIFLGIKYVTSSPDGKADLKKQLGVYILGFVLIVGATTYFSFNLNKTTQQQETNPMKNMTTIMTIMIIVMGFFMSSALCIYWITTNLFTIAQNLIVKRSKENVSKK